MGNVPCEALFISPPFKDGPSWQSTSVSHSTGVSMSVSWPVPHSGLCQSQETPQRRDKQAICAAGITDTLYSHGLCREHLKARFSAVTVLCLITYLSSLTAFKKKWLYTTNLMIMQSAANNNVLSAGRSIHLQAKFPEAAFELTQT